MGPYLFLPKSVREQMSDKAAIARDPTYQHGIELTGMSNPAAERPSNASSLRPTTARHAADKYTKVAAELPALLWDVGVVQTGTSLGVQHAIQDIHSWATQYPQNLTKLARMLKAADELTPINMTSQTQIGLNMATADTDGHVSRHEREPEVMRALGAVVVLAWEDLGHGSLRSDRAGMRCCVIM